MAVEQTFEEIMAANLAQAKRTLREIELRTRRNQGTFAHQPGGRVKRVSNYFGGDLSRSTHYDMDDLAYRRKFRHAEPIPAPNVALAEAKELGKAVPVPGRLLAAYCDGVKVVLTEATPFGVRRSVMATELRFTAVA